MKPIRELKGAYGTANIEELVDFARDAPVELPENQQYYMEMQGNCVHIYGMASGISQYSIGSMKEGMSLTGITVISTGIEIGLPIGEVEKIVLHSAPYTGQIASRRATKRRSRSGSGGESSPGSSSGESRATGRGSGRSKARKTSGESRDGGESR